MKLAMFNTATKVVEATFDTPEGSTEAVTHHFLPNGDRVSPITLGWSAGDYAVLEVTPFAVPDGKRKTGAGPTYQEVGGRIVETYPVEDETPVRRSVPKSIIQDRLIAAGKIDAAFTLLNQNAALFARWFAPDRSVVYVDDPDAIAFLKAIGADPATILAEVA